MKNVMKTILRNTKLVMILAFLPALLSAVQAQAVDYKNSYKPTVANSYPSVVSGQAVAPSASFQSTSAYSSQWAEQESATPMLNSDGTVNDGAYMGGLRRPGRVRRDGEGEGEGQINNPDDPDKEGEGKESDDGNTPLGDAVLPLMLLLCAYAVYKVRARKEA